MGGLIAFDSMSEKSGAKRPHSTTCRIFGSPVHDQGCWQSDCDAYAYSLLGQFPSPLAAFPVLAHAIRTSHTRHVLFARFSSIALARALCLCAALFLSAFAHAAVQPGYSIQTFQTEQGLPENNINSIIQSRDGYLWLATFGGLVRFDGVRFKVFDSANTPQLPNSRITALVEDSDGIVWIGHETGDLSRFKNGKFESITIPGSARREPIIAITSDEQSNPILFYQSAALRNVRTGALIETEVSSDQQRGVTSLVRDGSGAIWIMRAGLLWRVANGKSEQIVFDRFAADQQILGIGPARDGGVWIATTGRIRKRLHDEWTDEVSPLPWRQTFIPAMMEMRDGVLAVATMDQSIWLFRSSRELAFRADRNDGLPPDFARSLWEDREGNLWAAFGGGGIAALRPARATPIRCPDRWRGRPVLSVMSTRGGNVWAGTDGAGLYRYSYGAFFPVAAELGPPTNSAVLSFAEDRDRLWISAAEQGLYMHSGDRFQAPPGLEELSSPARVLFESEAQHALFVGAHSGLFKYENQKLENLTTNLVLPDVHCIAEQTNGPIWFGMFGGGLGKLENGKATQLRKQEGLASDFVQCLYVDTLDNALWIGTADSGLNRYKDGHFASITMANGLRDNVICHITDDGLGYVWISSHAGVMRVSKNDLNACADGKITSFQCFSFAETDGLPSAQCSGGLQPTGCRTPDGLLWFATLKGVAAIDPARVRRNQPPLVSIEEMRVNDAPMAFGKTNSLRIEPGRRRFDLDFTAISFAAPERVLFKYRLDPLEQEWVGPTKKRTVSYSHIPPGDYTFRVMACNSDGAWTDRDATLAFTVLPFFWQTLWFRLMGILAAFGIVGLIALLAARQRYRRQIELAERQRGIERERARIAQDIHDDLGSSLTRIILLSQSARGDLDSPELAASDLDRIYDTARNLTRSLDEIVWAVNPRHDTLDSLATYLGKFAQDFLGAANIRCRLDLPVSVPPWPLTAETRHNVFLAFKEALNNAVKHAQATEVRISLALEQSAFSLTVEDNGRGFSPQSVPAKETDTEDGLANMRKRLNEVGGTCKIISETSKGTRIFFHVRIDL
jgi:signal transduction histidine kinase/ligand-binding sensor domain-containing protein